MRIVFDLDGVLRSLDSMLYTRCQVPSPITDWKWKYNGKDIFDLIKEDYSILTDAITTKYFDVIMNFVKKEPIEIWTCQPDKWKKYTLKWIDKHIGKDRCIIRFLNSKEKYARLLEETDTVLVEDYPDFPDYERIILIDYAYNTKSNAKIRIKNAKELQQILEKLRCETFSPQTLTWATRT